VTRVRAAWTRREDDRLRRDWSKEIPVAEIAERLGRKPRAVTARVTRLGLPSRVSRWSSTEDTELRQRWAAGDSAESIGDGLERTGAGVYARVRVLGLVR
jgi:hypothetical protein